MTARAPDAVVTAAEVVTALGLGLRTNLAALLAGEVAVRPLPDDGSPDAEAARAFHATAAARMAAAGTAPAPEGPTRVVTPHGGRLDLVARAAHDEANLVGVPREAIALYVALGVVDSPPDDLEAAVAASLDDAGGLDLARFFAGGFRAIHPHWPLRMLNNVVVGQLAADLDVRGDNLVLAAEADAGVRAFLEAREALRSGVALAAVVAGASESVGAAAWLRARERGTPGPVLGEGAGAFVLESEAAVAARGAIPVGRLVGAATTFEPSEVGPGASARARERAARDALAEAGRTPADVTLLLVEGEDAEEAEARRTLFARRTDLAVVAPAVALGHLGPGGPAVASALALGMLAGGTAPSSARGTPRALRRGGVALVLASSSAGGAGALVWEGAP